MALKLILFQLLVGLSTIWSAIIPQKFAVEPQDQTVIIGSKVVLRCRIINKRGKLWWFKDSSPIAFQDPEEYSTIRILPEYRRFKITETKEGDFRLEINPITLEDEGKYRCTVSSGPLGLPLAIRSRAAAVTVREPPGRPEILQGETISITENKGQLDCVLKAGKLAAGTVGKSANLTGWFDKCSNTNPKHSVVVEIPSKFQGFLTAFCIYVGPPMLTLVVILLLILYCKKCRKESIRDGCSEGKSTKKESDYEWIYKTQTETSYTDIDFESKSDIETGIETVAFQLGGSAPQPMRQTSISLSSFNSLPRTKKTHPIDHSAITGADLFIYRSLPRTRNVWAHHGMNTDDILPMRHCSHSTEFL